ncbi:hypothetical protein GH714_007322 [Hevea brasiliensis]|uniref:Uncharacterized protein n=1 Tax=Hevea brasiliensis TaxID=3981 RepID=A0A6A6KA24_HEVBR|nr:hypothetical protein GH714_007322 [Hevea brasiliensis]
MEGVGSRLGRASSRYGPSATAAVFNGPVRKWRKKWVHVSPSSTIAVLEERRKAAKKVDHEAKAGSINQFTELPTSKNDEQTSDTALKTETQNCSSSCFMGMGMGMGWFHIPDSFLLRFYL